MGLMPSFWVIKNKEKITGVSVFFVDKGIDSGPILVQKNIKIENISQWNLIIISEFLGVEAIIEAVKLIQDNKIILIENKDDEASYFTFPTVQSVIDFKYSGNRFF